MSAGRFREWAPGWPNGIAIGYTIGAWLFGLWALTRQAVWMNTLGVFAVAHGLVCSAYLIHECVHHAVFASRAANDRLGMMMGWLNGACIASYCRLKKKHLRHHTDRLDVVTFDYRAALQRMPSWLQRAVLLLEWAYLPAIELLIRGMIIVAPIASRDGTARLRVLGVVAVRLAFFGALAFLSVKALLLYALAYWLFLSVLRFMDAFQHTYQVYASQSLEAAAPDQRRDARYEYENTYSNLVGVRWSWLNLLVLNFPYHNAHHVRPSVPWYRLPTLHRSLYGGRDPQVISCRELARSFHRHRVARVLADGYGSVAATGNRAEGFVGAIGVSFLTAV